MTRSILKGFKGTNPLGFMASVGLLRLLHGQDERARLGFTRDGAWHAWIECDLGLSDIADIVAKDAETAGGSQPWRLEYGKEEKRGTKVVADLKAPPERFSEYLNSAIDEWSMGRPEQSEYAIAYGTDVARDGNGNTKPTALHFTAANQQFLGALEETRQQITRDWVLESLDDGDGRLRPGMNLRWDPDADRSRALMGVNPNDDGTTVNAPLEWLAFRSLPTFPCVPIASRIVTCGVSGRRQGELRFHWPLWSCGASYPTVRSLLPLAVGWIKDDEQIQQFTGAKSGKRDSRALAALKRRVREAYEARASRGVFAICTSQIRRTAQGFGNFGPASVRS